VLSPSLLGEYRKVLLRDKIRALHGLSEDEIDRILVDTNASLYESKRGRRKRAVHSQARTHHDRPPVAEL